MPPPRCSTYPHKPFISYPQSLGKMQHGAYRFHATCSTTMATPQPGHGRPPDLADRSCVMASREPDDAPENDVTPEQPASDDARLDELRHALVETLQRR